MIVRFVNGLLLCLLPLWGLAAEQPVAIALHGGAGTIERDRMSAEVEAEYRSFLDSAISEGYRQLQAGEEGLDVVVAIIQLMEDSPLFNAGKGSVYTWDGKHELDASIMHGAQLDAGAVAGVTSVQSPIALARAVMEQSPHVMLASKGAEQFARELGIPEMSPAYFETERRKRPRVLQSRQASGFRASGRPQVRYRRRGGARFKGQSRRRNLYRRYDR